MIRNYLISTIRNVRRNALFSSINIFGLTIGLTFSFLIALYVLNENSYETFNPDAGITYRLNLKQYRDNSSSRIVGLTGYETGEGVISSIPEVAEIARIRPTGDILIKADGKTIEASQAVLAEGNFFTFFNIPLVAGEAEQVLSDPSSIVLTEEIAKSLFGEEDPIGKVVTLKSSFEIPLKVTGVAERLNNSHINYDILIPLKASSNQVNFFQWYQYSLYTYFKVDPTSDIEQVQTKLNKLFESEDGNRMEAHIQSLDQIYLTSSEVEFAGSFNSGNPQNLRILVAAAIFILMIACVNYVNTNTSRATKRAREVGVRKTMGASFGQLAVQFLGESFLISFIAVALALFATDLSLPFFTNLVSKEVPLPIADIRIWTGILATFIVVSLASGFYPALLMSRFNPSESLKGKGNSLMSGRQARKILIGFQFAITIILLSGTYIIYNQTKYSINKELGFNKDEVMVVSIGSSQTISNDPTPFQDRIAQVPGVQLTSRGMDALGPGYTNNSGSLYPEESIEPVLTTIFSTDMNFAKTYGIEIVDGRDFNMELASDSMALLVNEEFVRQAGWDNPIGKKVAYREGTEGIPVIGVMKDFNFQNLRNKVNPVAVRINKWGFWNIAVKVSTNDIPETIASISDVWSQYESEIPFDYYFLNERFARYYQSDMRLMNIIGMFSLLSIIVTCLGLYGLTSFVVELRLKEIGIRKTLGASSLNVTLLINRQFGALLLFGFMVSIPVTMWLGNKWLSDFAYRIDIQWWIFLLSFIATGLIAFITISAKSINAAFMNPVDTLRHE